MTINANWSGNYNLRISAALKRLGFRSILEFISLNRNLGYVKLAEILGPEIAGMQVVEMQFDEAERNGELRRVAKDSLLRECLTFLDKGWAVDSDFIHAKLASFWTCSISFSTGAPKRAEYKSKLQLVWKSLVSSSPPRGWIPNSLEDPYLTRAFDIGWPNDTASGTGN
jgi:hypothetical protein